MNEARSSSLTRSSPQSRTWWKALWQNVRRAFAEFLKIPSLVILAFLLLALVTLVIDKMRIEATASQAVWGGMFGDAQAARDFLGAIATGIITVTSITFSLLLISLQQGASALTSMVFDQFLRRKSNQLYFGFFVGLALYALIVLASVTPSYQPVYGVATAGVMTAIALYMLILLIYTSIDQMRPVVIITAIHDHTLLARERQRDLLRKTRRSPSLPRIGAIMITANNSGFLTKLDFAAIADAAADNTEVVVLISIGDYVSFGQPIAEISGLAAPNGSDLPSVIRRSFVLEEQRNLDTDPALGVEELVTIGWTSISSAKSDPAPGLLTIWSLRDILSRWMHSDPAFCSDGGDADAGPGPVVYNDNLPQQILRAFESLAVVASESMQHQCLAQIYRTIGGCYPLFSPSLGRRADDILLRSLSGLGDHILTSDLEAALDMLCDTLAANQSPNVNAIKKAQEQLAFSIGSINSRSTRAKTGAGA